MSTGEREHGERMIDRLDHLVLTTAHPEACIDFYTRVLGMTLERFGASATLPQGRLALRFGRQKINVHVKGAEFQPHAHLPVPGALDLCFIVSQPLDEVIARLSSLGVPIVEGPGPRTGACGPIRSIYLRDPDLNLIELSEYPRG
jgi:catechol 2,3-dioxygenase-like lactoylglutathione lyase family enzyme